MKFHCLCLTLALAITARSAPFQNLDFESAKIDSLKDSAIYVAAFDGPTTDLLPGWQVFHESQPATRLGFNVGDFDNPIYASLLSSVGPGVNEQQLAIQGNYTLRFKVDLDEYSVVQRGNIPSDAQFLEFTFRQMPFAVSINGLNLSPPIQNGAFGPSGDRARVDISHFAGQNVELKFTTSSAVFGPSGLHEIDAITFSVPEPSPLALVCFGGGCWLCWGFWRRSRVKRTR